MAEWMERGIAVSIMSWFAVKIGHVVPQVTGFLWIGVRSCNPYQPKNNWSFTRARVVIIDSVMPSRGRHQSSSKECLRMIRKIESFAGVIGVIIGRSYGGKSLGKNGKNGSVRVQREVSGGLKAVTQTSKGLQELFVRTEEGAAAEVWKQIEELGA